MVGMTRFFGEAIETLLNSRYMMRNWTLCQLRDKSDPDKLYLKLGDLAESLTSNEIWSHVSIDKQLWMRVIPFEIGVERLPARTRTQDPYFYAVS